MMIWKIYERLITLSRKISFGMPLLMEILYLMLGVVVGVIFKNGVMQGLI